MKRFFLILLFFISIDSIAFCQIEEGKYYPKPDLENFEGVWISANNEDSLVVTLVSKKTFLEGPNIYSDQLVGNYSYSKKGKTIENNLKAQDFSITNGYILEKKPTIILTFFLHDLIKDKRGYLTIELSSLRATEATWKLRNREGVRIVGEFDSSFSLPRELMLHKIE